MFVHMVRVGTGPNSPCALASPRNVVGTGAGGRDVTSTPSRLEQGKVTRVLALAIVTGMLALLTACQPYVDKSYSVTRTADILYGAVTPYGTERTDSWALLVEDTG